MINVNYIMVLATPWSEVAGNDKAGGTDCATAASHCRLLGAVTVTPNEARCRSVALAEFATRH
jgi:hypothetical protein